MQKLKLTLPTLLIIILSLFLLSYPLITRNLIVDEEPVTSDVIIVPEGGSPERARRSAQLLHEGYSQSDKIIISPILEYNAEFYKEYDVSKSQILPEYDATSTYENAVYTLDMMKENNFTSALVVSSDYHMQRVKLIYDRVNKDYGYDLSYIAAFHEEDGEAIPWYDYPNAAGVARSEFFKYWGYLLGMYHFINFE